VSRKQPRSRTRRQPRDPEREKRTIFVGNLPLSITQQALKKSFREYGCIETVRLRGAIARNPKIPKKTSVITKQFHPDQESIHGYVVFKEELAAQAALSKYENRITTNQLKQSLTLIFVLNVTIPVISKI
jgi:nucleolar protein 12